MKKVKQTWSNWPGSARASLHPRESLDNIIIIITIIITGFTTILIEARMLV